ncbi:MAG: FadR/GntR family transcriptional regulator [Lachnospiraceae bacterium]|nr:FadR/GntR family transcriptional regulator [Lachnospiraceae bacterium]
MSGMDERFILVKTNLYEQIADCLEELILTDEELQKEKKLPSEQTLAEKFGVSRNVIREALKILKERGLINPKNGTGSYITKPEASNLSDVISRMVVMDNMNYSDIYDVRIILETASCKRAALNATSDDLANMSDMLEKLKNRDITVEERRELDFGFHIAIAEAAGNPLLVVFVQTMKNLFLEMIEKGIFIEGGIDDAINRHANIMEALKAGDPNMAEVMMYDHLHFSKKNVENFYNNK